MKLKNYLLEDVKIRLEKLKTQFIEYSLKLVKIYDILVSFRINEIENLKHEGQYTEKFLDDMEHLLDKENFEHFLKHSICEIKILIEIVSAKFNNFDLKELIKFVEDNARNLKRLYNFVAFDTYYSRETNVADEFIEIVDIRNQFQEIIRLLFYVETEDVENLEDMIMLKEVEELLNIERRKESNFRYEESTNN